MKLQRLFFTNERNILDIIFSTREYKKVSIQRASFCELTRQVIANLKMTFEKIRNGLIISQLID